MIYSTTIKDSQLYVVENIQFIYLIIFHYSGSRQDDNKPSLLRPAVSCHSHSIDKPSIRLCVNPAAGHGYMHNHMPQGSLLITFVIQGARPPLNIKRKEFLVNMKLSARAPQPSGCKTLTYNCKVKLEKRKAWQQLFDQKLRLFFSFM